METFEVLGSSNIATYFIYGNHDLQESYHLDLYEKKYTISELIDTITKNNIIILEDEFIQLSDDLILLGRLDESIDDRVDASDLMAKLPSGESYLLTIDHQPYNYQDIIETKADLQLSGHSHAGQLFPLQLVFNLAGYNSYGYYHIGNTTMYVSSGYSGWKFPFRTEEHCQYLNVTLKQIDE